LYLPPPGYYQNDAGDVVPKTTPNSSTPASTSILSGIANGAISSYVKGATNKFSGLKWIANSTIEDWVFIVLGLLLIAAGIFAFKQTQTIIQTASKAGSKIAEVTG
jgi:hypothetical protein